MVTQPKSLSLSECDDFPLEQQWLKQHIKNLPGMFISIASAADNSLTVVPPSIKSNRKPEVTLQHLPPLSNSGSYHQQWILDKKTAQLRNVATKLCLVAYPKTHPKAAGNWEVGIETCIENPPKAQQWSFVRVQDNKNASLCAYG